MQFFSVLKTFLLSFFLDNSYLKKKIISVTAKNNTHRQQNKVADTIL